MTGRHRKPIDTQTHIRNSFILSGVVGLSGLSTIAPADAADISTWEEVAKCESSGNWSINTGNGYSGGLQFLDSTWDGFGGNEFADTAFKATKDEQIRVAERVLASQGWNAWPVCSKKAGATNDKPEPEKEIKTIPVPVDPPTEVIKVPVDNYTVVSGDTLSAIAEVHGTSVDAILQLNAKIFDADLIYVDQEIRLK